MTFKKMIKNKKAEEGTTMGGTILSLIIALTCVIFLTLLGVLLYNSLRSNPDLPKAEATLKEVMSNINGLQKTGDSIEVSLYNPRNWVLVYPEYIDLPNSCAGMRCLCLCEYSSDKQKFFNNCKDKDKATCTIYSDKEVNIVASVYSIDWPRGISGVNIEGNLVKIKISLDNSGIKIDRV